MKTLNKILLMSVFLSSMFVTSCKSWLDVKSEDRIMENKLYETKEGFMTALNGLYIDFISKSMYASNACSTLDIFAQYWKINEQHGYKDMSDMTPATKQSFSDGLWRSAYPLLNNVNTLLEHCDDNKGVLDDKYYAIVKGEALAFRALLHFDLLRLYGPVFKGGDLEVKTIPYANSSELSIRPLLSAKEVSELIMTDFKAAEALLKDYDPVLSKGALASDDLNESNYFRYRNFRLNYYAVRALIARAALHFHDLETAKLYSENVIKEVQVDNSWFPFENREYVITTNYPDRIFSSEILFAMYNLKRYENWFTAYSNSSNENSVLTMDPIYQAALYDGFDGDIRKMSQWEDRITSDMSPIKCFIKYDKVEKGETTPDNPLEHSYMTPVVRVSELYLILAEATYETQESVAKDAINKIRFARGIANIADTTALYSALQMEIAREFIGEGQLFWFYKRNDVQVIKSLGMDKELAMDNGKYVFTIPQEEKNNRK